MEEKTKQPTEEELIILTLKRLNDHQDFCDFRDKAIKPELIRLEMKLADPDSLSEVDLRTTLKMYFKLKEMFEIWFENAKSYKIAN